MGKHWPRGLRCGFVAACLLGLRVRNPPGAWMSVCFECCVLSGRGLCDGLIARPEESYRLWCVVVFELGSSRTTRPWPALGRSTTGGGGGSDNLPGLNIVLTNVAGLRTTNDLIRGRTV
jgi:hypothetical protein